ncbi:MAG TPA: metal ABC transporter permease [Syntrophales bacterium]|nr:metal ABC transporter permease [Syntrophales bacterium]
MEVLHFLIWPFIACILLILTHAYFGIHILERGIIFVDLSLAQFVGVGIALSFLSGHEGTERYIFSIAFAVLGAFILAFSRRIARYTNIEAFIGVLYIFSFAASILILDRSPHGLEEFKSILNGNIIWVEPQSVLYTFILYLVISVPHVIFRKRFLELSRNGEGGFMWEFLFFLTFAIMLVISVQMAGILQVFAFLIIPALIGRLFTRETLKVLICGWLLGLVSSTFGIVASYKWDLPVAPVIVASLSMLFFGILLVIAALERKVRGKKIFKIVKGSP